MRFPSRLLWPLTVIAIVLLSMIIASDNRSQQLAQTLDAPDSSQAGSPDNSQTRLEDALAAQNVGDYEEAANLYKSVLSLNEHLPQATEAAYRLGQVAFLQGDFSQAARRFADFRAQHDGDPRADIAEYWLAQAYRQSGNVQGALGLFDDFARTHPAVEDYVRLKKAEILSGIGDTTAVLHELTLIDAALSSTAVRRQADRLAADALIGAGLFSQAVDKYQALVAQASVGERLGLLNQLAAAQGRAGRTSEQRQALAQIIQVYPSSAQALTALATLQGQARALLTPYQIGRVYYFHQQNGRALAEFQRQRESLPESLETPWADYRTALVYERQGQNDAALQQLRGVIQAYPKSDALQDAMWERAWLLSAIGRYEASTAAYEEFRATFPNTPRAQDSIFQEGLTLFKKGQYERAAAVLGSMPARARNGLWRGKALDAAQDKDAARQAYAQAAQDASGSYYAFRAQALREPFASAAAGTPLQNVAITADEEADALLWLGKLGHRADATTLADSEQRLAADRYIQRGTLLDEMGEWDAATEEYRIAVRGYQADGVVLFSLARILHDRGQHAPAMLAVAYLQDLAPTATPLNLPRLLLKVLYPAPYQQQVEAASEAHGVDALLFYALIRQESLFNPRATSSAMAAGLTQVIPSTASEIASDLGVVDFKNADLYRPAVSIRFGSYYLSKQLAALGPDPIFALAAYNGGMGNALRWMERDAHIDPDLFLENIDFDETRSYVENVLTNLAYYQMLYRTK